MKIKNVIVMFFTAVLGGFIAVYMYARLVDNRPELLPVSDAPAQHLRYAALDTQGINDVNYPDFTFAAEKAIHCVVHVKVKSMQSVYSGSGNPFYDFFYGQRERQNIPREGFGSGVIMSSDGYIITNNHVINKADEIEVVLNDKRVFSAKLVGADPNTDLALLKIDENNLPFLTYGNSETLRVGEWVLAVGNPYNLTSTVTAGIVSAKARQLGIIGSNSTQQMGIESFIQTDAAVNPGNSGGALVNTRSELVGINTAIASQTGSYSGNSFAIPVTIVQKVIADLKEFGHVQRALLGIRIQEITSELAKEKDLGKIEGVYVAGVEEDGGAVAAGIKEGDVITAINNVPVNSTSELQEQVSKYRPNDQVSVAVVRNKKTQQYTVTLRNIDGNTKIVRGDILGAKLEEVSKKDIQNLGIKSGVKIKDVGEGKLRSVGIRDGFIITAVNDQPVKSTDDIQTILSSIKPEGRVIINGVYPNGKVVYYVFAK